MASSSKQPGIAAKKSVLTPVMTLEGHEPYFAPSNHEVKNISCISYFPDGKQIISGSGDKTTRRWDLREGKEIKEAREVYKDIVHGVGVSRDGRWVVTAVGADSTLLAGGSLDGTVRIWSLDTGKLVAGPFRFSGEQVQVLGLSQDSRKLAVISGSIYPTCMAQLWLQVWDVRSQKLVGERSTPMINVFSLPSIQVFWTTKGKFITGLFSLYAFYEYDASTLTTVGDSFQGHTGLIRNLALSFDCLLLASASVDNTIKLWSFESRQLLLSFDVQAPFTLILSPDSHQLAYTTWDEARIHVCDIPADILTCIGLAKETSGNLAKLLNVRGPALVLI
ncbi:uncharacterized protein F5147DRAFT_216455 [Suillus discolor]|uniref:WD40 repeat-like protein n=1 Tax=Suillus discolor TaxID=1912936 RepID=A0A9P7F495_9AGAM|nr:uncharacterized protein F5147DRAFT_216455 [Suillus discolor]KAG2106937.1 hypothetical protein F5147DRAFT_216455 [Suillus discolor]